jgi:hypothetical protein
VPPSPTAPDLTPGAPTGQPSAGPTVIDYTQQRTPEPSVFFPPDSDSQSEVDPLEYSGMLSPALDDPLVSAKRDERRYRILLQHDFHPSRPYIFLFRALACVDATHP